MGMQSKQEVIECLKLDRYSSHEVYANRWKPHNLGAQYIAALRYTEYYKYRRTQRHSPLDVLLYYFWRYRYYKLGVKLGFQIPLNVCGKGLSIHHYGMIIINAKARLGEFCDIQQGVVIGYDNVRNLGAPQIGNHVKIGAGAKIIGNISIADHVTIGANAVVTKDFLVEGSVLAGVPARLLH